MAAFRGSRVKLNLPLVKNGFPAMNWTAASEKVGLIAVVISLLYVGYELKRNNDLAVVESQGNLVEMANEMRGWLVDEDIRRILFSDDIDQLPRDEQETFTAMVIGWFDLYEYALLSYERGVLSEEQLRVWKAGMCNLPPGFLDAFGQRFPAEIYLDSLASAVKQCRVKLQTE